MTAHRRTRKTKTKRSNLDDNTYSERYRQASNGAKAARAAAAERKGGSDRSPGVEAGRGLAIEIGEGARIKSISLVPEGQGTGYILTVGEERIHEEDGTLVRRVGEDGISVAPFDLAEVRRQEDLRQEAASHAASVGQRGAEGASGEVPGQGAEPTFFEQLHEVEAIVDDANGAGTGILEAIEAEVARHRGNYAATHRAFFEAEVNSLPTHVGTELCSCDKREDHWIELGEI